MDKKFANLIYLNNENNKFAFIFIVLVLLLPNIGVLLGVALLFGKQLLTNNSILLPMGIYTISTLVILVVSFFSMENNKEKYIRIIDEGITYNSLTKRFSVPWSSITRVQINPYVSTRTTVMVHTYKGRFYFTGMFVPTDEELPKIKPGILRPKYYYQSGGTFTPDIEKNELYLTLKEMVPDKFY
ncbi:MAG: hypothetical protein U0457_00330 [Candidatus Sericytochromatia bacterium]